MNQIKKELILKSKNFNLDLYFKRIGLKPEHAGPVNEQLLQDIMQAQLFSVPFENLDVQQGKIVSMIPEDIFDKIVLNNRGGYCYEVNALFAMALDALNIRYQFAAARPMFYPVLRPKTHMVVIAELAGEKWLCDLGFGSYGIRAPIRLPETSIEVHQYPDTFRLSCSDNHEYLLEALVDAEWKKQYSFDLSNWAWIDFLPANYLNSTHPDTIFVQKILVVQHQPDGRDILLGNVLITIRNGKTQERVIPQHEINGLLHTQFGLPAIVADTPH